MCKNVLSVGCLVWLAIVFTSRTEVHNIKRFVQRRYWHKMLLSLHSLRLCLSWFVGLKNVAPAEIDRASTVPSSYLNTLPQHHCWQTWYCCSGLQLSKSACLTKCPLIFGQVLFKAWSLDPPSTSSYMGFKEAVTSSWSEWYKTSLCWLFHCHPVLLWVSWNMADEGIALFSHFCFIELLSHSQLVGAGEAQREKQKQGFCNCALLL